MTKKFRSAIVLMVAALVFLVQELKAQDTAVLIQQNLKLYPVLWHQSAAEYRALCYQAFNMARMQLDAIPKKKFRKEKLAVVTDLDETILDNSYSEAQLLKEHKAYTDTSWSNWVAASAATAVPGSVAFLQYAKQKGATIFYISNRSVQNIGATLINLQKLQLPDADSAHLLFLFNTSSKEERRQTVQSTHKIILLLGDNLNDFTAAFEKGTVAERFAETDKAEAEWGKRFIVLPNAIYGEWENAFYNYERNLSPQQKVSKLVTQLYGYK